MNLLFLKNLLNHWRMRMLKELRENNQLAQWQLAEALQNKFGGKWSQADISRYEKGTIIPPDAKVKQMAEYFGVRPAILRGEENYKEPIKKSLQPELAGVLPDSPQWGPDLVPIIGGSDGSSDGVILNFDEPIGQTMRHPNQQGMKGAFSVKMNDNSMEPRYWQGEKTFPIRDQKPMPLEDCWIELVDGTARLRQFIKIQDHKCICRQFNPPKDYKIPMSEIKTFHAVSRG